MNVFTKESLCEKFSELYQKGWVKNARPGNDGGVGNTLEDFLGVEENNLPIANAAEWELKCQRKTTTSLTTGFHIEPSPRAIGIVPHVLLPKYGWPHKDAGKKYPDDEMSFRMTMNNEFTDRGFRYVINKEEEKIEIQFDYTKVDQRHKKWLDSVQKRVGNLDDISPQPYWGFHDLEHKIGQKLTNCFYVQADVKKIDGEEYYWYNDVLMLQTFKFEKFLAAMEKGLVFIDFDARTGHNHGTKIRMKQGVLPTLYEKSIVVVNHSSIEIG